MIRYLQNIAILASQAAHTLLFPRTGNPDLTISARAHIETWVYGSPRWKIARNVINAIFFWQKDHCAGSFSQDVEHAMEVKSYMSIIMYKQGTGISASG